MTGGRRIDLSPLSPKMIPLSKAAITCHTLATLAILLASHLAHGGNGSFEQRLISPYNCYERAIGDIDGDGRNEVIAVAPRPPPGGAQGLVVVRGPGWKPESLVSFAQNADGYTYWRCDDLFLADINRDGRLDIVGALGAGAGTGITRLAWWENLGKGSSGALGWKQHYVHAEFAKEKNYIKNIDVVDMDGDGRPDVVTRTPARLFVHFQDSADGWTEKSWAISPFEGIAAGDLNGDGRPDIAVNGNWYEAPANPRRDPYVEHVYAQKWLDPLPPAKGFQGAGTKIVITDLDADGRTDIVVSPAEYGSKYMPVAWYSRPASKDAPWVEHVIEAGIQQAHSLKVGDLNGDGRLDVVTGGMRPLTNPDKGLWVYLQKADHSFTRVDAQTEDADKGAYSLAIGDLDGDGRPDIANARSYDMGPTEILFNRLGAGGGAKSAAPTAKLPLDRWHHIQVDDARTKKFFGLAMADVTGDGFKDVAAGQWFYRNPGGDMTAKWDRVALPEGVDAIAIVDVNGNDRGDIIALKPNEQFWLEAADRQGSTWTAHKIGSLPIDDHKLGSQLYAVAQVVQGGKPEIVIGAGSSTWVLHIPANPMASPWPAIQVTAEGTGNGVGDIDGDGLPDIVGSLRGEGEGDILPGSRGARKDNHSVRWWRNPGAAGGKWKQFDVGFASGADRFVVGDLNGDGRPDIAISDERFPGSVPNANLQWYENPGNSGRPWVRRIIATQMSMNSLDIADFDGDGDLDLVTCEHRMPDQRGEVVPNKERLQIWENNGRGTFTARTIDTGKESHLGARVADLDGDGDLDIVSIAWRNFQFLHVWRNDAVR